LEKPRITFGSINTDLFRNLKKYKFVKHHESPPPFHKKRVGYYAGILKIKMKTVYPVTASLKSAEV